MPAICVMKSATPVTIAILNSTNQVWNWVTSFWEVIPTSGTPTADQLHQLSPVTAAVDGALTNQLIGIIPEIPTNTVGCYIVAFGCDEDGVIDGVPSNEIDCIPMVVSPPLTSFIGGMTNI